MENGNEQGTFKGLCAFAAILLIIRARICRRGEAPIAEKRGWQLNRLRLLIVPIASAARSTEGECNMLKRVIVVILWTILTGGFAYAAPLFSFGVNGGSCVEDNEIPLAQHNVISSTAMRFVKSLLGSDRNVAYGMMTNAAQRAIGADKFDREVKLMVQSMAPFADPRLEHIYLIKSIGTGPDTRTVCGSLTNHEWVALTVRPGQTQAHVIITSKTRNNDWAFTLWLLPAGDAWQVAYFHMGVSSIVGITPDELLTRARSERDAGRAFNAAMLYAGVRATTDRGPDFQLGIVQTLNEDLAKFSPPAELSGKPPFTWKMEGHNYVVDQVSIMGVQGKLGLVFILPHQEWNGDQEADRENKEFLKAFVASHPDFSRVFRFLVARAMKPDNSGGFGTVYQATTGFN